MTTTKYEKVAFFASLLTLLFLYGYGSGTFGWFPDSFLDRALLQAAPYFTLPSYVSERVFDEDGVVVIDEGDLAPGLTLIATHAESWDWSTGLRLIDKEGQVVREWPVVVAEVFDDLESRPGARDRGDIHGSYVFENGDVLVTVSYIGIARLDACGEVQWRLQNRAHHSISRADDGTFWVPITSPARKPSSGQYPDGYPGLDRPINHDQLLRISPDGEPLDSISVLDLLYSNDLTRFLSKARPRDPSDLMHVNDIEQLSSIVADQYPLFDAGDLLVSLRSSDLVMVVDPETEEVKWHISDPLVHQHDPDFIGNGWIGIFDNREDGTDRGALLGGSRIVAFQPHTDSSKVLFPTPESASFYTPVLGKWQLLNNGNMLLTEGVTGRIMEVAPDGRSVWEWINPPYDNSHSVELTEGTRYPFTAEQVAAWPCSMSRSPQTIMQETE